MKRIPKPKKSLADTQEFRSWEIGRHPEVQAKAKKDAKELLKLRRGSLARRIGSKALSVAAGTIAYGEITARTLSEVAKLELGPQSRRERYRAGDRTIRDMLKKKEEQRERIPDKVTSRFSRLGKFAMDRITRRSGERDKAWKDSHRKARDQYLTNHPEILEREKALEQAYRFSNAWSVAHFNRESAARYLKGRNIYSFSKLLPRRPENGGKFEGSYDQLAQDTLKASIEQDIERDGTIHLSSADRDSYVFKTAREAGKSPEEIQEKFSEHGYGVASLVWKLGFVDYASEKAIPYSRGEFNDGVTWEQGEKRSMQILRLPYDASNELHQQLSEQRDIAPGFIELRVNDPTTQTPDNRAFVDLQLMPASASQIAA